MRRMARILALGVLFGGVTFVAGAAPASAHICTNAVEVKVGKEFSVNIGVAAEDKPISEVDIAVPKGFDLVDNFGFLGWVGERHDSVVTFSGGIIEPYQCGYFTLKGTAPKKGVYQANITAIAEDGTRRLYKNPNPYSAFPAMMLYADTPMPAPEDFANSDEGGGGDGPWRALGVGLAAGALVVGVAWKLNQRRSA